MSLASASLENPSSGTNHANLSPVASISHAVLLLPQVFSNGVGVPRQEIFKVPFNFSTTSHRRSRMQTMTSAQNSALMSYVASAC